MVILVDAMGGDNAPDAVIKGAVKAVNEVEANIMLIGNEEIINKKVKEFKKYENELYFLALDINRKLKMVNTRKKCMGE